MWLTNISASFLATPLFHLPSEQKLHLRASTCTRLSSQLHLLSMSVTSLQTGEILFTMEISSQFTGTNTTYAAHLAYKLTFLSFRAPRSFITRYVSDDVCGIVRYCLGKVTHSRVWHRGAAGPGSDPFVLWRDIGVLTKGVRAHH